ncbi:MAG: histidine--tRNA ligase [Zetaproteobacteria bacterium]|nr:histidine--tRNA ligase [Zetaproteobacteria bacterium]
MKKIKAQKLKGFMDVAPHEMRQKAAMMEKIRQVAELFGFGILSTPTLEYSETLLGVGGETDKQVFRFRDNGDRDVCLRFDLTLPLARYIAENYGKVPLPAKCLQMGNVFRAEKPQKGRYREFTQCDLDIVGVDSMDADVEVLVFVTQILRALQVGEFVVRVGNRSILNALQQQLLPGLDDAGWQSVLIAVDKLDKIGEDAVAQLIADEVQVSREDAARFVAAITDANALEQLLGKSAELDAQIQRFTQTCQVVNQSAGEDVVKVDLSIARGLGYYTGMVFETNLLQHLSLGSVCSGGRYNGLVSRFLRDEVPCVGLSVGLSRLQAALSEGQSAQSVAPIYLFRAEEVPLAQAVSLAAALRAEGLGVDLSIKKRKLAQHFKHADKAGFAQVIYLAAAEDIRCKQMSSGEEASYASAAALLQDLVSPPAQP